MIPEKRREQCFGREDAMIEFLFDILALGCSSYILLAVLALVMLVILLACFETDPVAGIALTLILLVLGAFAVRDQKKKKLSREEEDTGLFEPEQEKKVNPVTALAALFLALLVVGVLMFLVYSGQIS